MHTEAHSKYGQTPFEKEMSKLLRSLLCLLVAGTTAVQAQRPSSVRRPASAPTLLIVISVDGMRPDYFQRFGAQLTGGLARLYSRGAVFTNAFQDHAITETAPGHATTLSGRFPASTGIISNEPGVHDPSVKLIDAKGPGASPSAFRGTTLVDWLVARDARTKVLSVSRKDRAAILPIGRSKQHVYWYASDGTFTTSTYYRSQLPQWVKAFNDRKLAASYAGKAWTPLLGADSYSEPDSVPYENGGEAFTFPHVAPTEVSLVTAVLGSFPWIDDVTLALALDGARQLRLGAGPQTDVLAISLSATDGIGHLYGPDSREMHDQILRLDRNLGTFLDSVTALRGSRNVVVALTADHGMQSYPEVMMRDAQSRRVEPSKLVTRFRAELRRAGVSPRAFEFSSNGVLKLNRTALSAGRIDADALVSRFAAAIRVVPGVLRAETQPELMRADTVNDGVARRWIHTLGATTDADLIVTLQPYSYWSMSGAAQHGGPHDGDAQVPLIFYGPQFRAGKYERPVRVVDLAPTLARILGVNPSEQLDGRPLTDVIR